MTHSPELSAILRLVAIMQRLRDPLTGCSWDMAQSSRSIAPYAIEEAYELVEAIESNDQSEICAELGDLLLQVVFHSEIARSQGSFDITAVANGISEKMERRHPHIFSANSPSATTIPENGVKEIDNLGAESSRSWEAIKKAERAMKIAAKNAPASSAGSSANPASHDHQSHQPPSDNDNDRDASIFAGLTVALPALTRAVKLQKRAAMVGFDWIDLAPVVAKVSEELAELTSELALSSKDRPNRDRIEEELGDLLFAIANLARHLAIDPEQAARRATVKFERRFRAIELILANRGKVAQDLSLEELEQLWQTVKQKEKQP